MYPKASAHEQYVRATMAVVHRDPGAVGAGFDGARRHNKVRPEPDRRLQPADTPEEHRTVRGV